MPTFYNFRQDGVNYRFDDVFVPADLFRAGNLWSWGSGSSGRLGNADITERSTPVTIFAGATNWKQVSSTAFNTAAIKTDGTLWTWGSGIDGLHGNAVTTGNISTPITTFAGGNDWKQVSCGAKHIAAIKTDGTLWTWGISGRNVFEGRTTGQHISTPVTTSVGGTNWKQVSCGYWYTAAVKTDGSLWTWGYSYFGQLGRPDDYRYKGTPVTTFAGGTNWSDTATTEPEDLYTLSAGYSHSSAIKTDGTLWTWGSGTNGQLGNAVTTGSISTPITTFAGGTDWKQVSGGASHTAAIKTDGTLWVWGNGLNGRLGNAVTTGNISTPVTTFAGGTNWKQVSAGGLHIAAIKTDGTLWTWGSGGQGQLGNDFTTNRSTPVTTFAGGTNWKQVSGGGQHTTAIKTDGTLWTWGIGSNGQLGFPTENNLRSTPVTTFAGGTNWADTTTAEPEDLYTLSAGYSHSSAIKTDGTLWVWGNGLNGRLGNAVTTGNISTPVTTFAGGTNWKQVSSGNAHTAAIKTDGTLWTWSNGLNGRLGNAQTTNRFTPVTTFAGGTDWKQVSSGNAHTAAIKTDGTLWTWGSGVSGRLGNAVTTGNISTPITTFAGGTNWKQVSAGGFHTAAIKTDGTLWTWGAGGGGRLGDATLTITSIPVTTFAGGNNWKQVSAGSLHTAAIKTDGTLWTWGSGVSGRLGNAVTTGDISTPVTTFAGGTDWKQVSSGNAHTIAIKTDGTLWTWGLGTNGRLGDAVTTGSISTPITTFAGGTDWKQVSAGGFHTVALKDTDGNKELFVFGNNLNQQLGINIQFFNSISTPSTTFAGGTNWKQVSAGNFLTAAIKTDGTLWTWGSGSYGQLGTNDTINRFIPVTTFAGGTDWKQVSAGRLGIAAIKTDGTLWTWGNGSSGQLGNDEVLYSFSTSDGANVLTPITTFAGGTDWKQVSCGDRYTLAIRGTLGNYQLFGFGDTYEGQLGGAINILSNSIPKPIFGNSFDWKQVDCGYHTTAAIKTNGTLWTWGRAQEGILGAGGGLIFNAITPITTFAGGTNWKQVSVGGYYANNVVSAVKTDGTLWIWGEDNRGILGRGGYSNNDFVSTPITTFAGGTNWKSVSAGGYNVFGIKTDGTLWGWGQQYSSQLGVGDDAQRSTPVTTFAGGTNWKQIDHSFGYHTAAVTYDDPVL
jgi:alpha-tubulin suppressor-like RCC1 family protein